MTGDAPQDFLSDYSAGRLTDMPSIAERQKKLRAFAGELAASEGEICAALKADLNRESVETALAELLPLLEIIRFVAKKLPRILKKKSLPWGLATFPARSFLVREPYGRVLIVSTWNYPFLLSLEPALGAYAAGNRTVLKLSSRAPESCRLIRKLVEKHFSPREILVADDAMHLPDLLKYRFDYIFCTGGRKTGEEVQRAAAEYCTPVTLELGGKNPCIVTENADLAIAAKRIAWGKFFNGGQSCIAPDHLWVHRRVREKFQLLLCGEIRKLYGAAPLKNASFAALPDAAAYERICALIKEDSLIYGGKCDPERRIVEPTLLEGSGEDPLLMNGEIFGPVLPILEYSDDAELIRRLSLQEHPLALYCFGGDKNFRRILTERIPAGAMVFNDVLAYFSNMHIPFGGVGRSGFGAYHGIRTVTTFLHEKPVIRQWELPFCFLRYPPYSDFFRKLLRFLIRR